MMSSTRIVRTAVVRKPGLGLSVGLGLISFGLGLGLVVKVLVLVLRIWSCSHHCRPPNLLRQCCGLMS